MSLNSQKLSGFQREILARREALAAELRACTAQLIEEEEMLPDSVDQAQADQERMFTRQMHNRDLLALGQMDEALQRIQAGTFGECERCGEEISEGRIRAFPLTTLCIECKAEIESEEHRYSTRQ
jgi:DnaK suppressor protein